MKTTKLLSILVAGLIVAAFAMPAAAAGHKAKETMGGPVKATTLQADTKTLSGSAGTNFNKAAAKPAKMKKAKKSALKQKIDDKKVEMKKSDAKKAEKKAEEKKEEAKKAEKKADEKKAEAKKAEKKH